MNSNSSTNPFFKKLDHEIRELGGMFNAHLHLDRAGTLDERYMQSNGHKILDSSHVSLQKKHGLINVLHAGPAYDPDDLRGRVNANLDVMIQANTLRADTMVDVTADEVGLSALQILTDVKHQRADEIDLRIAAYSPFGYVDSERERWDVYLEGAKQADFLGCLPEADDTADYPSHIGFFEHCRRMLELSSDLGKMLHVHVDQRNEPSECGTETLIEAVRRHGAPSSPTGEPMVWAVHLISPSTYDESRFQELVTGLVECNIGVVCCPSAAIGMRQLRPLHTPTYNSIPRVLEMLAAGVHVRLGSDNIADICSPSTTADLRDEVFVLSAALRFYHVGILAKLAAGQRLDATERRIIGDHLKANDMEIVNTLKRANLRVAA